MSLKEPKQEIALKDLTKEEKEFRELAADSNLMSEEEFQNRKIVPADMNMKNAIQVAQMMCRAKAMLPEHLHGNPGECLAMILLAQDWGLNAYTVGQNTYIPTGAKKIAFTGQLVNAVINKSRKLVNPLRYEYSGEGSKMKCKAFGTLYYYDFTVSKLLKEDTEREVEVSMPQNIAKKGKNNSTYYIDKGHSPLWDSDPKQQLAYKAQRFFCRLHMPEILMGCYTGEEILEMGQVHQPERDNSATPASNLDSIISDHNKEKSNVIDAEITDPVVTPEKATTKEVEATSKEPEALSKEPKALSSSDEKTELDLTPPVCNTCKGRGIVEDAETKGPCPECRGG